MRRVSEAESDLAPAELGGCVLRVGTAHREPVAQGRPTSTLTTATQFVKTRPKGASVHTNIDNREGGGTELERR